MRAPGVTNEMIAIHDFLPTLANIIGADIKKLYTSAAAHKLTATPCDI